MVWEDGRIVPEPGDLARMLEDVKLESGGKLRADQNVQVQHVAGDPVTMVGIRWRDEDGTHVMAMDVEKLEVVP